MSKRITLFRLFICGLAIAVASAQESQESQAPAQQPQPEPQQQTQPESPSQPEQPPQQEQPSQPEEPQPPPPPRFNRLNFNVGGGFGGAFGDVGGVTDKSYHGVAGVGWNLSRRWGVKAEYMYYNLAFKDSVKREQSLPEASGRLQSATLNLFYQRPLQGKMGVYAIGGAGWYQRRVEARSQFLPQGTVCQPAWELWAIQCTDKNLVDPAQTLSHHTVSGGGYNFGGGITYRLTRRMRFYVEGRYHHVYTPDHHTNVFPVTVGLRW